MYFGNFRDGFKKYDYPCSRSFLYSVPFVSVDLEAFTDVFAVKFERLEVARRAKKMLDAHQFYGGILHISYAPERESLEELREKIQQRRHEVAFRIRRNQKDQTQVPKKSRKPHEYRMSTIYST